MPLFNYTFPGFKESCDCISDEEIKARKEISERYKTRPEFENTIYQDNFDFYSS